MLRTKEYLVAIRPLGDLLCMETLLYADEVVNPAEIDGLPDGSIEIAEKELAMAKMLVETSASEHFDPSQYRDEYREKVQALIEAKSMGTVYELPAPSEAPKVVDLMAALEASLAAAKAKKAS